MTDPSSDVARRRRLAEVWRATAPSRDEIVHLRSRLERRSRRPTTSRGKVIVVALVQGLFFGAATLAAAAWIAGEAPSRAPFAAVAPPSPPPAHVLPVRSGTAVSVPPASTASTPTAAFDDTADEAPRPDQVNAPPASIGGSTRASSARALAGKVPLPPPTVNEKPPTAAAKSAPAGAAPGADASWARVAQAMSAKDWTAADRALNDLSSSGDPTTRDAADLARAELAIARGQTGSLRPLVERLARSGATGLIQKRAAALLDRLPSR